MIRTEKQAAIARAIVDDPAGTDTAIAKRVGASISLVRRIRQRMRDEKGAPTPPPEERRSVPWPKALDVVFAPGGSADELEEFVGEIVSLAGRLDRRLAELEVTTRGRFVGLERRRVIRDLHQVARLIQHEIVPVGACPFCKEGCSRCVDGRWVPAAMVDAFATIEEKQRRSRWWRRHTVEVPGA